MQETRENGVKYPRFSLLLKYTVCIIISSHYFVSQLSWRSKSLISAERFLSKLPLESTGGFSAKFRVGGCRPQFENVTVG